MNIQKNKKNIAIILLIFVVLIIVFVYFDKVLYFLSSIILNETLAFIVKKIHK